MRFNLRSLFWWITVIAMVILLATTLRNRHLARWKHSKSFWHVKLAVSNMSGIIENVIKRQDRVRETLKLDGSKAGHFDCLIGAGGSSERHGIHDGKYRQTFRSRAWKNGDEWMEWRITLSAELKHGWDWRNPEPHCLEIRYPDDNEHRAIADAIERHLRSNHSELEIKHTLVTRDDEK